MTRGRPGYSIRNVMIVGALSIGAGLIGISRAESLWLAALAFGVLVAPGTVMMGPLAGQAMEPSEWLEITQDRVNQFADATNDHQFIHVKPLRAKFTPFRGTIAHGLLSLSLIGHLVGDEMPVPKGHKMTMNYGSDKVRYITPVRVGKRIRAVPKVLDVSEKKPGQWLVKTEITIEIEGEDKPALIAEILIMHFV